MSIFGLRSPVTREQLGKLGLCALYIITAYRILSHSYTTGRLTGGFSLITISLAVWFVLTRRPATTLDSSWSARLMGLTGTAAPLLLRPASVDGWLPDQATGLFALVGAAIAFAGLAVLGRSFGVLPADRGLVFSGIYGWIRHPLYAGYVCSHVSFVLAYPTARNVLVWLVADGAQLVRIRFEEGLLSQRPEYQRYMRAVRWRLIPGIY